MKKIIFFTIVWAFSYVATAWAQLTPSAFSILAQDSLQVPAKRVIVGGFYSVESIGINNRFFNHLLSDSYIDDETKNSSLPKLSDRNRLGAAREMFAAVSWPARSAKLQGISYMVVLRDRLQYSAVFPSHAYELALYGNGRFEGKTAILDDVKARKHYYQTMQFGMMKHWENRNEQHHVFGASLGLVSGSQYVQLGVKDASIYTAPFGDSLYVQGSFDYRSANQRFEWYQPGGYGLGFSALYRWSNSTSAATLIVEDAGFIAWKSSRTRALAFDTAGSFSGIHIEPGKPAGFSNIVTDVQERIRNSTDSVNGFTSPLPMKLMAAFQQKIAPHAEVFTGLEINLFSNQIVRGRAVLNAQLLPWLNIQPGVNVMGYTKLGIELGTVFCIAGKHSFYLGTQHLEGFFAPEKTTSQGLYGVLNVRL